MSPAPITDGFSRLARDRDRAVADGLGSVIREARNGGEPDTWWHVCGTPPITSKGQLQRKPR